jgi:restriction endonuclease S subunit
MNNQQLRNFSVDMPALQEHNYCIIAILAGNMNLADIATISSGHPFRGKIPEVGGSGSWVIQMKDASPQEGIDWAGCIQTAITGKREPDWLKEGDILVAARGSNNYAVLVDFPPDTSIKAVAAPYFYVISQLRSDVLPAYLTWLLNQTPCQRYFEQNAEGTLTKSIRRTVLECTPVAIPPLAKQQAIIALVSTLRQEQQIVEQLLRNGEGLLSSIAFDLLNESTNTRPAQGHKR